MRVLSGSTRPTIPSAPAGLASRSTVPVRAHPERGSSHSADLELARVPTARASLDCSRHWLSSVFALARGVHSRVSRAPSGSPVAGGSSPGCPRARYARLAQRRRKADLRARSPTLVAERANTLQNALTHPDALTHPGFRPLARVRTYPTTSGAPTGVASRAPRPPPAARSRGAFSLYRDIISHGRRVDMRFPYAMIVALSVLAANVRPPQRRREAR